jgi:hypothetical protein
MPVYGRVPRATAPHRSYRQRLIWTPRSLQGKVQASLNGWGQTSQFPVSEGKRPFDNAVGLQ